MNLPADMWNDLKTIMQIHNRNKAKEAAKLANEANAVNNNVDKSQKSLASIDTNALNQQIQELVDED